MSDSGEHIKEKLQAFRDQMRFVDDSYDGAGIESRNLAINKPRGLVDRAMDDSYHHFAKLLPIKADRSRKFTGDKNLVSFHLMEQLLQAGYQYVAKEFLYHNVFTDFFCMDPGGRHFIEIELKISRSDFLNDFRKQVNTLDGRFNKHILLSQGELFISKFYFLVPDRMIAPVEVPKHCGLIYFQNRDGGPSFTVVRRCPILHDNPAPDGIWRHIADRLFSQLRSYRAKFNSGSRSVTHLYFTNSRNAL